MLDVAGELPAEAVVARLLQLVHVGADVLPKDVVTVHRGVELARLRVVTGETLRAATRRRLESVGGSASYGDAQRGKTFT